MMHLHKRISNSPVMPGGLFASLQPSYAAQTILEVRAGAVLFVEGDTLACGQDASSLASEPPINGAPQTRSATFFQERWVDGSHSSAHLSQEIALATNNGLVRYAA